jgi:hypothetical protein
MVLVMIYETATLHTSVMQMRFTRCTDNAGSSDPFQGLSAAGR